MPNTGDASALAIVLAIALAGPCAPWPVGGSIVAFWSPDEFMMAWSGFTCAVARMGALLALGVALSACAGVPSQEMSDARRAVDAARESGAARHAPLMMERASQTLGQASAALRAGDYDEARRLAANARDTAISARTVGDAVGDAEGAIARARAAGRPVDGAREVLDRALDAARDGQTARALEMANRARELAR